jgi:hypothetical protein
VLEKLGGAVLPGRPSTPIGKKIGLDWPEWRNNGEQAWVITQFNQSLTKCLCGPFFGLILQLYRPSPQRPPDAPSAGSPARAPAWRGFSFPH